MRVSTPSPKTAPVAEAHVVQGNSTDSIIKLRRLISDLINEVDSLDQNSLPIHEAFFSEDSRDVDFYAEVQRFEIALIKAALRKSHGHQLQAARLLHLNSTTLNSKIKQYQLQRLVV